MHVLTLVRRSARWGALIIGVALALYFLNSAAFSAWMAGGPPNPYPEGWSLRSKTQLLYSCAALVGGVALFQAAHTFPAIRRVTWAIGVVALLLALAPSAILHARIDACLDQGGRWSYVANQCEH